MTAGVTHSRAPVTTGFECSLPIGTVIEVVNEPPPTASAIYCRPTNYDELEASLVPEDARSDHNYDGYSLIVDVDRFGAALNLTTDRLQVTRPEGEDGAASDEKKPFIVCDDYGMGGLWGVMMARSEAEITAKYPELVVVPERPAWMTDESYERMWDNEMHDIDGLPWGMLNGIMADREKRRRATE